MKKLIFAPLLMGIVFAACSKEDKGSAGPGTDPKDTSTVVTISKYAALTTNKWKLTEAVVVNTAGETAIDYYSTMEPCQRDNYFLFHTDGSITMDEGASKCTESDPQTTTDGNWSFSADTTTMTLSGSTLLPVPGNHTIRILTLTATTLKVSKDTTITYPGLPVMTGTFIASLVKL